MDILLTTDAFRKIPHSILSPIIYQLSHRCPFYGISLMCLCILRLGWHRFDVSLYCALDGTALMCRYTAPWMAPLWCVAVLHLGWHRLDVSLYCALDGTALMCRCIVSSLLYTNASTLMTCVGPTQTERELLDSCQSATMFTGTENSSY